MSGLVLFKKPEPTSDLTITVDRVTREYLGYKEHKPGAMIVAPCDFIHRRMYDMLPSDLMERVNAAVFYASRTGRHAELTYELNGWKRKATLEIRDSKIIRFEVVTLGAPEKP